MPQVPTASAPQKDPSPLTLTVPGASPLTTPAPTTTPEEPKRQISLATQTAQTPSQRYLAATQKPEKPQLTLDDFQGVEELEGMEPETFTTILGLHDAANLSPHASKEEHQSAARFISHNLLGIESLDGSEYAENRQPMNPYEYHKLMVEVMNKGVDPLRSEDMKEWDEMPPENIEDRYEFARQRLSTFDKAKAAVGRAFSSRPPMPDELWELPPEDREPDWEQEISPMGEEETIEEWMARNPQVAQLMDAAQQFQAGKPIEATGADASWWAVKQRAQIKQDMPAASTPQVESEYLRRRNEEWKRQETIAMYEAQLDRQNTWRLFLKIKPLLSQAEDEWAQKRYMKQPMTVADMAQFEDFPLEKQQMLSRLAHGAQYMQGRRLMFDAASAFTERLIYTPVNALNAAITRNWKRLASSSDEYQKQAESKALLAEAMAPLMHEYGYAGQTFIGVASTIPYGLWAGIPYVGIPIVAMDQFGRMEDTIAAEGGKVTGAGYHFMNLGTSFAYAMVERLQAERIWKGATNLEKRNAYRQFFRVWGLATSEGRSNWLNAAPTAIGDILMSGAFEHTQEILQAGVEGLMEAWGTDKDISRNIAESMVQEWKDSMGTMYAMGAIGGIRQGVGANFRSSNLLDYHEALTIAGQLSEAQRSGDQRASLRYREALRDIHRTTRNAGTLENAIDLLTKRGVDPDTAVRLASFLDAERHKIMTDDTLTLQQKEWMLGKDRTTADILKQFFGDKAVTPNEDGTVTLKQKINQVQTETTVRRVDDLGIDATSVEGATSVVQALQTLGMDITLDEWMNTMTAEERQNLMDQYGLFQSGRFQFTAPTAEGDATVTSDQLQILTGEIALDTIGTPSVVFHEALHAFVAYARAIGLFTESDIQKLQEEFGQPRPGINELFNEENAAEAFRSIASLGVDFVTGSLAENIYQKASGLISKLLGAKKKAAEEQTIAENLAEQVRSGVYTGIPIGTITTEQRAKNEAAKEKARQEAAEKRKSWLKRKKKADDTKKAEEAAATEAGDTAKPSEGEKPDDTTPKPSNAAEATPEAFDEEAAAAATLKGLEEQEEELPELDITLKGVHRPFTPDGKWRIETELVAIQLSDMINSADPTYPQILQPRNRNAVGSLAQIDEIARNPNVEQWVGGNDTDGGYLLITPERFIVSGNGRHMAILESFRRGTLTEAQLDQFMRADAAKHGIVVPEGFGPFLIVGQVNHLPEGLTMEWLAELSNRPKVMVRTQAEAAQADAKTILKHNLLRLLRPSADGDLLASSNHEFIRTFSRSANDSSLTDTKGYPTREAAARIRRALLATIIGGGEDSANVIKALIEDAPKFGMAREVDGVLRAVGEIMTIHTLKPQYSLADALSLALRDYFQMKVDRTRPDQGDLFYTRPEMVQAIVEAMHLRRTSSGVYAMLHEYAAQVALIDTTTRDLFGTGDESALDVLKRAIQNTEGQGDASEIHEVQKEIAQEEKRRKEEEAKGITHEPIRIEPKPLIETRYQRLSPDSRVVANLSVQQLLGKKAGTEQAARLIRLFGSSLTTEQALQQTKAMIAGSAAEIAKKHLKDGEHVKAVEHIATQSQLDMVEAVRAGMAEGTKIGKVAKEAEEHAQKKQLDEVEGIQLRQFEMDTGISWVETMLAVTQEQFAQKPKTEKTPKTEEEKQAEKERKAAEQAAQDEAPPATPEQLAEREAQMRELVELSNEYGAQQEAMRKKRRLEREKKKAEQKAKDDTAPVDEDAEDTEADEEYAKPIPIPKELLETVGVKLDTAEKVAHAMRVYVANWLVKKSNGRLTYENVWRDAEAIETYRKTMQGQLSKIANASIDPANRALARIAASIAEIPRTKNANVIETRARNILTVIQANAIRATRNQQIKELTKDIEATAIKGQKMQHLDDKTTKKVGGEIEMQARFLRQIIQWGPVRTEREIAKLRDSLTAREQLYKESKEGAEALNVALDIEFHRDQTKLMILERWGNLKSATPAEFAAEAAEIRAWLHNHMEKIHRQWFEQQEMIGHIVSALHTAIIPDDPDMAKKKDTLLSEFLESGLYSIRQRLEGLIRYQHDPDKRDKAKAAINELAFLFNRAATQYNITKLKYLEELQQVIRQITGGNRAYHRYRRHLEDAIPQHVAEQVSLQGYTGKDGGQTMTFNQALNLYASLVQDDYARNVERHNRQTHAELLRDIFTPQDIAVLQAVRHLYENRRAELSKAMYEITGIPMWRPGPLYMPVMPHRPGVPFGKTGDMVDWSPLAKSFSRRVPHKLDFDERATLTGMYFRSAEDSARAIGYGKRGLIIQGVLGNKAIQDAVDRYYGSKIMTDLMQQVVHAMKGVPRGERDFTTKLIGSARSLTGIIAMSWNALPALKQTQSIPVFSLVLREQAKATTASDILPNAVNTIQENGVSLSQAISGWSKESFLEIYHSEEFRSRYGTGSWMAEAAEILANEGKSAISRLYKLGLTPLQWGDFFPSAVVLPGLYKALYQSYVAQGYDEAISKERAMSMAWEIAETSQQTARPDMLHKWWRHSGTGGELIRLFAQFGTAPMQQLSHEFHAALDVRAGVKGAKERLVRSLLINHIVMPHLLGFVRDVFYGLLGREPEEEEPMLAVILDYITAGAVSRFLILGAAVEALTAAIQKKRTPYGGRSVPAESLNQIIYSVGLSVRDIMDWDLDALQTDVLKAISGAFAPARHSIEFYRNRLSEDARKKKQRKQLAK